MARRQRALEKSYQGCQVGGRGKQDLAGEQSLEPGDGIQEEDSQDAQGLGHSASK